MEELSKVCDVPQAYNDLVNSGEVPFDKNNGVNELIDKYVGLFSSFFFFFFWGGR